MIDITELFVLDISIEFGERPGRATGGNPYIGVRVAKVGQREPSAGGRQGTGVANARAPAQRRILADLNYLDGDKREVDHIRKQR